MLLFNTFPADLKRRVQPKHDALSRANQFPIFGNGPGATAQSDNGGFITAEQLAKRASLLLTKRLFTVLTDYSCRTSTFDIFDSRVQIKTGPVEQPRQLPSHHCLSTSHETDYDDQLILHLSTSDSRRAKKSGKETATLAAPVISDSP